MLLPFLMLTGFIAYDRLLALVILLMPIPQGSPLEIAILMSRGFLAATLMAALAARPLAWLYGPRAMPVAGLMILPVLVQRMPALLDSGPSALTIFLSTWELLTFAALLSGGTWFAQRALKGPSAA